MVSYELPLGISVLTAIVVAGTLSITEIVEMQYGAWLLGWNVFRSPFLVLAFVIYFVASLAECKRAPFDLPEAESELVSGFHTEYSSMRFSIFFLAEYAAMYVVAAFAACLFLGGWYSGIGPIDRYLHSFVEHGLLWPDIAARKGLDVASTGARLSDFGLGNLLGVAGLGSFVLILKAMVLVFFQMAARWTYPRLRLDQIMYFCLKVLLPISLFALVGATVWELVAQGNAFFGLLDAHDHGLEYVEQLRKGLGK
jgi:NADH-quinone oxidoreductase subunit H